MFKKILKLTACVVGLILLIILTVILKKPNDTVTGHVLEPDTHAVF